MFILRTGVENSAINMYIYIYKKAIDFDGKVVPILKKKEKWIWKW
jgi:hypothetical protein